MHPLRPLARVLVLTLALTACRATRPAHASIAGCHPACAGADTAAIADAGAELRHAPAAAEPVLFAAPGRAPSAAAFLCPMHTHVGADAPGRCPECNMKLVPRAEVLGHDHGR
jgi:hypothetical protein